MCPAGLYFLCHPHTLPQSPSSSTPLRKSRNVVINLPLICAASCVQDGLCWAGRAPREAVPGAELPPTSGAHCGCVCPAREAVGHSWKCFWAQSSCCCAVGMHSSENCSAVLPGPATALQGDFPGDAFQGFDFNGSYRYLVCLKTRQIT